MKNIAAKRQKQFTVLIAMACAILLAWGMFVPSAAQAVTGSQVAADGTYSSSTKEGTVQVTVSNGKITSITAPSVKSKYQSYITSLSNQVKGKDATATNIDAITASTKHVGYIKSGAQAAIANAPAAGTSSGGDSGSVPGTGGGSGEATPDGTKSNPYVVKVRETLQIPSKNASDGNYSGFNWSTSASEIQISAGANTSKVTITGIQETTSPVTLSCTSSLMGMFSSNETIYVSVVAADSGGDDSGSGSGGADDPVVDDEIGKGVGTKTGTKYTGRAEIGEGDDMEYVVLDVYVDNGKITGVYIADQDGHWLDLLTNLKDKFLGTDADVPTVDAISSATTKGFRNTLRDAVKNALPTSASPSDPVPTSTGVTKIAVTKDWDDGANNHTSDEVEVGIYDSSDALVETIKLNDANNWKATTTTALSNSETYTVKEDKVTSSGSDVTSEYEGAVTKGETTTETTSTPSDAGKTLSPGGSATIAVGETLKLQGTKPSSYGNYHYWYTDEEDVDFIEWDINNNASSYYYAGTNIANIQGLVAGTVVVTHQYVSGGSWVNPGETFTITVVDSLSQTTTTTDTYTITNKEATIEHAKSIEKVSGKDNEYIINLTVKGKDREITTTETTGGGTSTSSSVADIVFVVDTTFSMNNSLSGSTRLAQLKSAMNAMVDSLPENADSKVKVVNFEAYGSNYYSPSYNSAETSQEFNLSASGKNSLKAYINALSPKGNSNQHYGFTYPDKGMTAGASALNGMSNSDKYLVFFTDGEPSDTASAVSTINTAKSLKDSGVTVYSVGVLVDGWGSYVSSTGTAPSGSQSISFNGSSNTTDANKFLHAVSSNYPQATASGSTIAYGSGADSGYYMLGSDASSLTSAFSKIGEQVIEDTKTTTKTETVHMTDVVVKDTLSSNVELNGAVTVVASDGSTVNYTTSGTSATIAELADGVTYTVKIPIKVTQATKDDFKNNKQSDEANYPDTSDTGEKGYFSNDNNTDADKTKVTVSFKYGDAEKTVPYEEKPVVQVVPDPDPEYTVKFVSNGKDAMNMPADITGAKVGDKITEPSTEPSAAGYKFKDWTTKAVSDDDKDARKANKFDFEKTTITTDMADEDGIIWLYAAWDAETYKVHLYDGYGADDKDISKYNLDTGFGASLKDEYKDTLKTAGKYEYTVNDAFEITESDYAPTRAGYTFLGWTAPGETTLSKTITIAKGTAEDIYFKANWEPAEYTITYDLDGGMVSGTNPTTYTVESDDITLTNPTKDGYTFKGWTGTDLASATDSVTIAKGSTGNRSYTATWEKNTDTATKHNSVTVTKVDEDGTTPLDGATFELKDGNTVVATYTANPFTISTDDTALASYLPAAGESKELTLSEKSAPTGYKASTTTYAVKIEASEAEALTNGVYVTTTTYTITIDGEASKSIINEKKAYTITFVDEDGTVLDTQTVSHGDTPKTPTDPTKAEDANNTYTFSGWDKTIVPATEDATYKATYTATAKTKKYKVTFVDEDGTTLKAATEYDEGTKAADIVKPDDPSKDDTDEYIYTFAGWTPTIGDVTGDVTYKATYTATKKSYTVTWVDEDGTVLDEETYEYGETPSYKGTTPTKAATDEKTYTFEKWSSDIVVVTENATYTASYTDETNTYTVTYMDGLGNTLKEEKDIPYGDPTPTCDEPTRDGYTFTGWTPDVADTVSGNATYTASWEQKEYTITFVDEDGTELSKQTVKHGDMPTTPEDPTKAEDAQNTYAFGGWDKEVVAATEDATYTATYTPTKKADDEVQSEPAVTVDSPQQDDQPKQEDPNEETKPADTVNTAKEDQSTDAGTTTVPTVKAPAAINAPASTGTAVTGPKTSPNTADTATLQIAALFALVFLSFGGLLFASSKRRSARKVKLHH